MTRPIAVTMGEPAGIGPELILIARKTVGTAPFYAIADANLLADRARAIGLEITIAEVEPADAIAAFEAGALPVVPLSHACLSEPGEPSITAARGVVEAIERAVGDVAAGAARAIVTAPIAKEALYAAGFPYPGHTEFLGALAEKHWGSPAEPVMMIWSEIVAVVPVTIHIPLSAVPGALTSGLIHRTGETVARDLTLRFGIARPRLAVAGLNPHAGEGGALGREDIEIVAPAVEFLRAAGIDARGPLPADTLFHARARTTYDVALCMYHDQALAPAKALAFDEAVNVTLGLPFIRTSPDHGTAYDLAGSGRADPSSFLASLRLADRLSRGG